MATYADIAARNSSQTREEARANPVDQVITETAPPVESLIDVNPSSEGGHVHVVPTDFEDQEVKTQTQQRRLEEEAAAKRHEIERLAADAKHKARREKNRTKQFANDHPALIGNGIITALGAIGLGYVGFQKYKAGELDWKVATIGVAGVITFSVLDAFITEHVLGRSSRKEQ